MPPFSFERGLYRDDGGTNRLYYITPPITAHRDRVLAVFGTIAYDTEHLEVYITSPMTAHTVTVF